MVGRQNADIADNLQLKTCHGTHHIYIWCLRWVTSLEFLNSISPRSLVWEKLQSLCGHVYYEALTAS